MTQEQLHDNRVRLGQRIAQIREEKGLTQQQVADASGLLRPNVARLEAGKYNVGIDVLAKIAASLGCTIDVIPK